MSKRLCASTNSMVKSRVLHTMRCKSKAFLRNEQTF